MAENTSWLLITVSTQGNSTLRVYVWRKLRRLGAHYLHRSVCLLPDRDGVHKIVERVIKRVGDEGGRARALPITISDRVEAALIVEAFNAERQDEYAEFCSRTPAFLEEIASERAKDRATYTEVEESEADLVRLRTWLGRIRERDYFDAPGYDDAARALALCEEDFESFEAEAMVAEDSAKEEGSDGPRIDEDKGLRVIESGDAG